ncbi:MAG TPA: discoidin domain-containing protein [Candidatus Krumholzibacteria bacterium]|nr:discoidin domain-containing protein [Candidatus Krumholzibacteria bacterium]HPD73133.1 discoidin domain-containing protein [Candidatus Krumholzibacteria bacterium]HRY41989.1 discoidin domain-containing protein [Candidatus Krumholzibacteria bacterium]
MRKLALVVLWVLITSAFGTAPSLAEVGVSKTACISLFGGKYATADDARDVLLAMAKEAAVQEIFGEFIRSRSKVEDFALSSMDIETTTVGFVRVRGNPRFYQGDGFGEICIAVDAYVSDEDLKTLEPRLLTKTVVVADPNLTLKEVEQKAKEQACLTALIEFDPKLKENDPDALLTLLHEVQYSNGQFIEGTTAYSIQMTGTIYPIELLALQQTQQILGTPEPLVVNLPASAFTASSVWMNDAQHASHQAKFTGTAVSNWSAAANNLEQWLQVDLGAKARIQAVGTKGRYRGDQQWVTSYSLSYSLDGANWTDCLDASGSRTFRGNADTQTEVRHTLSPPIVARYVRFHPAAWNKHITMRVEVYGSYIR